MAKGFPKTADATVQLIRLFYPRTGKMRKDWPLRWQEAGKKVHWEGVEDRLHFKAKANSPIWGVMASIYPDGTRSKKPPFAINSGMGWKDEQGKLYYSLLEEDEEDDQIEELTEEELLDVIFGRESFDVITRVGGHFV